MKKLLTFALLSSIFLTGCSVDWNDAKDTDSLFRKKVECVKIYKGWIETSSVKDIFYSPSLNTCILGAVNKDDGLYNIFDILTKTRITASNDGKYWTKEEYDNKIKELKGE